MLAPARPRPDVAPRLKASHLNQHGNDLRNLGLRLAVPGDHLGHRQQAEIRVAEQLNELDVLSNGRAEFGAARFFRRTGEGVYDMDDLARATAKMADFAAAHVAAARPSSVLGLGYSNGANILASVLFAAPGLFDAAVLMHPLIPFEPQDRSRLDAARVLVTAGRRDPMTEHRAVVFDELLGRVSLRDPRRRACGRPASGAS